MVMHPSNEPKLLSSFPGQVADFIGYPVRVTTSWCRWKGLTSLLDGWFKSVPLSVDRRGLIKIFKGFHQDWLVASLVRSGNVCGLVAWCPCVSTLGHDFEVQSRHNEFVVILMESRLIHTSVKDTGKHLLTRTWSIMWPVLERLPFLNHVALWRSLCWNHVVLMISWLLAQKSSHRSPFSVHSPTPWGPMTKFQEEKAEPTQVLKSPNMTRRWNRENSRLELVIEGLRGTNSLRSGVGWEHTQCTTVM